MRLRSVFTLLVLSWTTSTVSARKPNNAVLLSSVRSLTLRDGQSTTHRRVSAIPQLTCVGGNAKGLYNVDVMRCENSGSEYDKEDISWTCKASLPPEFKLGSTDVICEGYESPDDPYILKGSCAVEYRLALTDQGEEKYPNHMKQPWRTRPKQDGGDERKGSDTLAAVLFWLIFGAIVCAILYSIFFGGTNQNARPRGNANFPWGSGGGGGGGGGGGDDGNDPPPPYTPRAQPRWKSSSVPRYGTSQASTRGAQDQWRPGFWSGAATGAAAGAAAGYAAGSRGQARAQPAQAGPSNWFGGNGGGRASSNYGSGSTSSSPAPSTSRHESTGFGGTRRR